MKTVKLIISLNFVVKQKIGKEEKIAHSTISTFCCEKNVSIPDEILVSLINKELSGIYIGPPKMKLSQPINTSWDNVENIYSIECILNFTNEENCQEHLEEMKKNGWTDHPLTTKVVGYYQIGNRGY